LTCSHLINLVHIIADGVSAGQRRGDIDCPNRNPSSWWSHNYQRKCCFHFNLDLICVSLFHSMFDVRLFAVLVDTTFKAFSSIIKGEGNDKKEFGGIVADLEVCFLELYS